MASPPLLNFLNEVQLSVYAYCRLLRGSDNPEDPLRALRLLVARAVPLMSLAGRSLTDEPTRETRSTAPPPRAWVTNLHDAGVSITVTPAAG